MDEPKVFVFYVGVGLVADSDRITEIMDEVRKRFFTEDFVKKFEGSQLIMLPVRDDNSRVECINPKYITDTELIREHRLKLDYLHENLNEFIKENKK